MNKRLRFKLAKKRLDPVEFFKWKDFDFYRTHRKRLKRRRLSLKHQGKLIEAFSLRPLILSDFSLHPY
jgi:hypothetical protein